MNNETKEIDEVKEHRIDLFNELYDNCMNSGMIDVNLYEEFDVKRGLRDANGRGVLTGLTEISDVLLVHSLSSLFPAKQGIGFFFRAV